MRGLRQRKAEWQLVCLTHNLLKLWRAAPAESGPDRRRDGLGKMATKTACLNYKDRLLGYGWSFLNSKAYRATSCPVR